MRWGLVFPFSEAQRLRDLPGSHVKRGRIAAPAANRVCLMTNSVLLTSLTPPAPRGGEWPDQRGVEGVSENLSHCLPLQTSQAPSLRATGQCLASGQHRGSWGFSESSGILEAPTGQLPGRQAVTQGHLTQLALTPGLARGMREARPGSYRGGPVAVLPCAQPWRMLLTHGRRAGRCDSGAVQAWLQEEEVGSLRVGGDAKPQSRDWHATRAISLIPSSSVTRQP